MTDAIATNFRGACPDCQAPTWKPGSRCRDCHAISMAGKPPPDSCVVSASSAARGSAALLRRQLELGMHWITDPVRFEAACEIARAA